MSVRNFFLENSSLTTSCRLERDDCDLGGAVEPNGKADGANAAVDVELHLVEAVVAFRVFQAHGRQDERPQEGKSDLATVGVSGKHEVDEGATGVGANVVGVVGRVCHQEYRTIGVRGNGQIEVGVAGAGIVDATEPEAGAVTLDGYIPVDQDGGTVSGEGIDNGVSVEGDVVVAEDRVAKRGREGGEDLGAATEGVVSGDESEGAVGNEVAGKEHKVGGGGEAVDLLDDALEEVGFGVLVEVDVADLDDAVAVEGRRQVSDGDDAVDDVDLVAGDLAGVQS